MNENSRQPIVGFWPTFLMAVPITADEPLHATHGTHGAKKNKRWNSVSASAVADAMARQDER
jgi:hypothetical protein